VIRAMMLLRLSTLATGRTGVRPEVAEAYAAMLSAGLTPVVREYGSLGCSGDLAPLAHCALALMGEGSVIGDDGRRSTRRRAQPRTAATMQEDHVSMGWSAGLKLRRAVAGLAQVIAIELLAATRALDLRAPLAPAPATAAVRAALAELVSGPGRDRFVAPEIVAAVDFVRGGRVREVVEP
jgi:histidine ammonia-lyase